MKGNEQECTTVGAGTQLGCQVRVRGVLAELAATGRRSKVPAADTARNQV